jgi:hypothetical protein
VWKDNSIRVIRRYVLSSTDEKSYVLGSGGCFPQQRTKLAKKTCRWRAVRIISLPVQHLLPTAGRHLWFVQLITTLTSNLYTDLIRQSIRENNSTNSQAKNTTMFQPNVFLNGIRLLFMDIKQPDFLQRHHCQGHSSFRESPTTWLHYALSAIWGSTVHHNACFSLPEHADWVYFSLKLYLCSLWAFTAWLKYPSRSLSTHTEPLFYLATVVCHLHI